MSPKPAGNDLTDIGVAQPNVSTEEGEVPGPWQVARAAELGEWIDACPTPYHAVYNASRRLAGGGFSECDLTEPWRSPVRRGYVPRGGTLVAWSLPDDWEPTSGLRIIAAHTDSPGLRLKPRSAAMSCGWSTLHVEVYGSPILHTWMNRPLRVAGRIFASGEAQSSLVDSSTALVQIPSVAVHLDRQVNVEMRTNAQVDTVGVTGLIPPVDVVGLLAEDAGVQPDAVTGFDVMLVDAAISELIGADRDLLSAPRLDNLCSSWSALEAIVSHAAKGGAGGVGVIVALFDHEEVGSVSDVGADSEFLNLVVRRALRSIGVSSEDFEIAVANSWLCSADMAHATHPARPDLHDPHHQIIPGGGPVLKFNASQRYTTDGASSAFASDLAASAGLPLQRFVMRNDMACGSTVGPAVAARLGVPAFDIGAPQLSMHSARELMATVDVSTYAAFMAAFCGVA
ncbi:MAG: M18 family aminopeptidase [Acidimicrobiia bacterium]|nr:M18 family aminopeptidase [Acidimicrobiia bacterium]MBP8181859.1 M18 family aminopeptidase [Acidimicrobiia bacterium]